MNRDFNSEDVERREEIEGNARGGYRITSYIYINDEWQIDRTDEVFDYIKSLRLDGVNKRGEIVEQVIAAPGGYIEITGPNRKIRLEVIEPNGV